MLKFFLQRRLALATMFVSLLSTTAIVMVAHKMYRRSAPDLSSSSPLSDAPNTQVRQEQLQSLIRDATSNHSSEPSAIENDYQPDMYYPGLNDGSVWYDSSAQLPLPSDIGKEVERLRAACGRDDATACQRFAELLCLELQREPVRACIAKTSKLALQEYVASCSNENPKDCDVNSATKRIATEARSWNGFNRCFVRTYPETAASFDRPYCDMRGEVCPNCDYERAWKGQRIKKTVQTSLEKSCRLGDLLSCRELLVVMETGSTRLRTLNWLAGFCIRDNSTACSYLLFQCTQPDLSESWTYGGGHPPGQDNDKCLLGIGRIRDVLKVMCEREGYPAACSTALRRYGSPAINVELAQETLQRNIDEWDKSSFPEQSFVSDMVEYARHPILSAFVSAELMLLRRQRTGAETMFRKTAEMAKQMEKEKYYSGIASNEAYQRACDINRESIACSEL